MNSPNRNKPFDHPAIAVIAAFVAVCGLADRTLSLIGLSAWLTVVAFLFGGMFAVGRLARLVDNRLNKLILAYAHGPQLASSSSRCSARVTQVGRSPVESSPRVGG